MNTQTLPAFDAEKAVNLTLGAASPLWFVYAGAGMAGAAFYWMSRWTQAANLEAMMDLMSREAELAGQAVSASVEIAEEAAEAAAAAADPVVESMPGALGATVAAIMPEPTAEAAFDLEPDDLTQIKGVGPKLAAALGERGITRFADIAKLSKDAIEALDAELKLMGRITRDNWVGQAKKLV